MVLQNIFDSKNNVDQANLIRLIIIRKTLKMVEQ